jgi:hypothetical protein
VNHLKVQDTSDSNDDTYDRPAESKLSGDIQSSPRKKLPSKSTSHISVNALIATNMRTIVNDESRTIDAIVGTSTMPSDARLDSNKYDDIDLCDDFQLDCFAYRYFK